jgi:hypothetical protein
LLLLLVTKSRRLPRRRSSDSVSAALPTVSLPRHSTPSQSNITVSMPSRMRAAASSGCAVAADARSRRGLLPAAAAASAGGAPAATRPENEAAAATAGRGEQAQRCILGVCSSVPPKLCPRARARAARHLSLSLRARPLRTRTYFARAFPRRAAGLQAETGTPSPSPCRDATPRGGCARVDAA